MIRISTLFSGSSGNCTLVRSESTAILVDCGRNCKAICTELAAAGLDLSDISAVFITHEHRDHISALDVLTRRHRIPVHVTKPSSAELMQSESVSAVANVHPGVLYEAQVGDMHISSFPLPHDSAAHVGYVISDASGDTAGVATDMGYVTRGAFERLSTCRQAVVESNYDPVMLRCGSYPQFLKQRILGRGGHLSNDDCARLCLALAEAGTESVLLAHLSSENNTPQKAFDAVSCAAGEKLMLKVAARDCLTDAGN